MVKPLALTSGEPAGIGPDIAIAAWLRRAELKLPAFYLTGDRDFFRKRAKLLGLDVEIAASRYFRAPSSTAALAPPDRKPSAYCPAQVGATA